MEATSPRPNDEEGATNGTDPDSDSDEGPTMELGV